ncbi:MAG: hypothetical protein A3J10_02885 [Candidatus Sungbacteria bacterium RIFCSPLOWO2_02_FULL_54_10]|uniref:Uncharacterized protein n=1 Tax=Candidatus Sungbacteria bacterium RIFCSPHIGHO2_02_FULL_53_17 TaxID=1802275 RepID=A0A1G2KT96_9BACT|nr:MAG: hypothetical protein A3C92_02870 [Candidatus Sungbacteria bacterium RIFCSPHIGHO2_02_FULL_53_17]OHA13503.1 MAG: hypothetical protein A3J10_02885 [Candidatus Sungbacteria bacterium RIFCSPLOWO2_02_FULL_54_10]
MAIVAVLCCIDPKIQPGVFEWAEKKFGRGNFTLIPTPGAELPFVNFFYARERKRILNLLRFIRDEMGLAQTVLISHSGCVAWARAGKQFADPIDDARFHGQKCSIALQKINQHFRGMPMTHHWFRKDLQQMMW